ncbi:hypothetical protein P152DRAFT_474023 [Eremomyces bilateralis CBS 781.70]|uniref:Uncharacterized protein n=1 Tax=Eremomyces bilateralis CBS 781.70 TaxID=1392243 RepID=A0A6G1G314_9PEZI|nr:uncharacterized protein P152DRAFT_474023 [Eremomyces bilateralis CBS 781.70]KAF1812321.1 hypothetical protein P152DRAFT_474023 [Eremomyces bilateralis CBS 781.70]
MCEWTDVYHRRCGHWSIPTLLNPCPACRHVNGHPVSCLFPIKNGMVTHEGKCPACENKRTGLAVLHHALRKIVVRRRVRKMVRVEWSDAFPADTADTAADRDVADTALPRCWESSGSPQRGRKLSCSINWRVVSFPTSRPELQTSSSTRAAAMRFDMDVRKHMRGIRREKTL